jgi:hypothetical protein
MLALWGLSLIPPIERWGDPAEDGCSYVPTFYATLFCLPTGLYLMAAGIAGHGPYVTHARLALFVPCGVLFIVLAFLVFQWTANSTSLGSFLG